jgi:ribosomal protein S18 acetylase RimI-like enzyme/catechol 2,3-dioxygenase-like lactoylglutathione lyase family enzyme
MKDWEIRELTPPDVASAVELLARQLEDHDIPLPRETIEEFVGVLLARPDVGRVLIARIGSEVAGAAVLSFVWTLEHGGATLWLDELYVLPAHRDRGIGRALVDEVVRLAEASGCRAVDLEIEAGHEAVARLYERAGFRRHARSRWFRPSPARAAGARPPAPAVTVDPRPFASLDHVSLGVNDLARSRAFYDATLAPLGLVAHEEIPGELAYGPPWESPREGFAFYIGFEDPAAKTRVSASAGFHVAFRAPSRAAVREFHAAALANGGRDNGAPGLRPKYHPHYYGAFVLDPDGHHVEAACHAPEA